MASLPDRISVRGNYTIRRDISTTIQAERGNLPADLLQRIA